MKRIALSVFVVLVVTSLCFGQWLERSLTIGDTMGTLYGSSGVLFNPLSGNVYVGSGSQTLIFNPATLEQLPGIPHPGVPIFCPTAQKVYLVANPLSAIDAAADTFIRSVELGGSIVTGQFRYSPQSNRFYCLLYSEPPVIAVVDCATDSLLDFLLPPAAATALEVDTAHNRLFVGARSAAGDLYVYDCAGETLVGSVRTGLGQVTRLAFSPTSCRLYCYGSADTAGSADRLLAVDAESLVVRGLVAGALQPYRTVFNPALNRIAAVSGGSVQVIDCVGDSVLYTRELGAEAMDVTVSPVSGRTYVGVADPDSIFVLDASDSVVARVPAGESLGRNVLSFATERNELYCALYSDSVLVIDAAADTIRGIMDYAYFTPRAMVHNPAGNKLYLLCPGKDMVLVMGPDCSFRRIPGAVTSNYAISVLHSVLNRLYVADAHATYVVDCNADSLVHTIPSVGISRPEPVLVPGLNKLYLFPQAPYAEIFVYDCLRDSVVRYITQTTQMPCAVYDPRSNRIFFACQDTPSVRVLDPVHDVVVKTFSIGGGSTRGRMAVNPDLGRLYYTDQTLDRMFTLDVQADTVAGSIPLPWDIDSLFLNRKLGKLYLCSRDHAAVLVFDCRRGAIIDTVAADYQYSALMDDRNDKLYLRYGAVMDCRYDSVVTMLPPDSLNPRCMAWNMIDNRVYQASSHTLYVYRDDPSAVEEVGTGQSGPMLTVLGNPARGAVNLRLQVPSGQQGTLFVYDAAGRLVHSSFGLRTSSITLDVRSMSAGVFFVCLGAGGSRATAKVVLE